MGHHVRYIPLGLGAGVGTPLGPGVGATLGVGQ